MAFVKSNTTFYSFASYADVIARDPRFFEANEGVTEEACDIFMEQASQRILSQIRNTDWWKEYAFDRDASLKRDLRQLPQVNPFKIIGREQEFKDLNIYFAMLEYLLPSVADFGNPQSAEVEKIKFYKDQYTALFTQVIESGDWYDFDGDSNISVTEKSPSITNRVRTR